VNTDLSFYDLIVPCGLVGKRVTSMQAILGREVDMPEVATRVTAHFGRIFSRKMLLVSDPLDLDIDLCQPASSPAHQT
jgi:lipoate-protein ligase B